MTKQTQTEESVYKVVEVIGTSTKSWRMPEEMRWKPLRTSCTICGLPSCENGSEGRGRQSEDISHARVALLQVWQLNPRPEYCISFWFTILTNANQSSTCGGFDLK